MKPCICGNEKIHFVRSDIKYTIKQMYKCKCFKCGTETTFFYSKKDAEEAWNKPDEFLDDLIINN